MQGSAEDTPGLRSRPGGAGPGSSGRGGPGGLPIHTPITAALSLMRKMDGVARLLAGACFWD